MDNTDSAQGRQKRSIIYCFTGTGNALRLATLASREFERHGYRSSISPVEKQRIHPDHGQACSIGIASPVLGFGLPRIVARFIRRMPWGAGQEAIILISMGNAETIRIGSRTIRVPPTEGIALFQAAFWLRRRGYSVGRGSSFELPTNWILAVNPPAAERVASMDAACGELIRKQVGMIARGEPEPRIPRPVGGLVAASVLYAPVYVLFALGRRPGGKWFVVNDRCDSCGRCASQCPQGTIKWRRDKPYWGWDCQQCYRCINTCPQAAIEVSILTAVGTCAPAVISGRLFRLIPLPPGADRMPYSAICGVLLFVALTVCMAWLVHYLYGNTGMRRILPAWYFTARRRRYRHMDFDPAGFRRL